MEEYDFNLEEEYAI